jgi:hypothetical protein
METVVGVPWRLHPDCAFAAPAFKERTAVATNTEKVRTADFMGFDSFLNEWAVSTPDRGLQVGFQVLLLRAFRKFEIRP